MKVSYTTAEACYTSLTSPSRSNALEATERENQRNGHGWSLRQLWALKTGKPSAHFADNHIMCVFLNSY
jgi:hypothetical protein